MFYRLHDDDGIIDDQSNRQDHTQKRQGIDGESKHGKDHEGRDQRDRNGEQRNERGPQALEKDVDDDNDQEQRFSQCLVDFVDAGADRECRIERGDVVQPLGKPAFRLVHHFEDSGSGLQAHCFRE